MKRNIYKIKKNALRAALIFVLLASVGCETSFSNQNSITSKPTSVIKAQGMQLYLQEAQKRYVDKLILEQGEYMIGFRLVQSHLTGVAHCKIRGGINYKIKIIGRTLLKQTKTWALIGECQKKSTS